MILDITNPSAIYLNIRLLVTKQLPYCSASIGLLVMVGYFGKTMTFCELLMPLNHLFNLQFSDIHYLFFGNQTVLYKYNKWGVFEQCLFKRARLLPKYVLIEHKEAKNGRNKEFLLFAPLLLCGLCVEKIDFGKSVSFPFPIYPISKIRLESIVTKLYAQEHPP